MGWGRLRAGVFALALGSLSCGESTVAVVIDVAWSEPDRADIMRAGWAWRAVPAAARITFPTYGGSGDWLVMSADTPGGWGGYVDRKREIVRIDPDREGSSVYAVALHEFGHMLGMPDLPPGKPGVMDPSTPTEAFSEHDAALCSETCD